jgi:hypothetical protein
MKSKATSPKEICWGPTIYCSKQNKRKLKAKVKTLQEKRIVHKAIKYSVLKGDLIFADEEGVPQGHSQALMRVPLGYFLGCVGIPKLELLSILQLTSSFSNPYT